MRFHWSEDNLRMVWLGPGVLGALLIGLGLLLAANPRLLAYFVAGVFILAGAALLVTAWRTRRRVTYRRVDAHWEDQGSPDDPRSP